MGSREKSRVVVTLVIAVLMIGSIRGQSKIPWQNPMITPVKTYYPPHEISWANSITTKSRKPESLIGKGELGGFFSLDQFWRLHSLLRQRIPNIVGQPFSIGKTYQGKQIEAFFLQMHAGDEDKKAIVLFDALHHAREFVTLSMIVKIIEEQVAGITNLSKEVLEFFKSNRVLIVPVVNVDSFSMMCKAYNKSEWNSTQWIRKNQNGATRKCYGDHDFGGVDLNRNYPVHFGNGSSIEGSSSDPCNQEYRGEKPFSEPETLAIRNIIARYDRIVSAMNFHAYGGLWIYPANFQETKGKNILRSLNIDLWRKYKLFEKFAPWSKRDSFGNAMKTIEYYAQGEASDWMALNRGIFAFSPELGTNETDTNTFYPEPQAQLKLIEQNYKIVRAFLNFHIPKFKVTKRAKNSVTIELVSVFPVRDIMLRVMDQSLKSVKLNGQDITTDIGDIGLRFGDAIELQFYQNFQAALVSVKQNWNKDIKKGWKRFVQIIFGRNYRETIYGYTTTKFDRLATIGVFF